ncbi:MAG: proteasome accessory factor PafA2 family protein [Nitrospiria bacterium]
METRIMGLETEYGCLLKEERPNETPGKISYRIKDYIFRKKRLGLFDLHYRANDEPPGNGGFLLNGGRLYLDMGHLEYASPECIRLADLVAYDRAGDRILQEAIEEMGLSDRVSIIKNNIDHQTGATFGSHENYLVGRDFPFSYDGLGQMIPFLVTRQIFTGAGRVGAQLAPEGWVILGGETGPKIRYQLSQRADHIVNDFYQWIQFNRAIINTRDEPLADPARFRRVHLLLGDSNMLEYAVALKLGTTSLVLSLIEAGAGPSGLALLDPVVDLKQISRDPERRWIVTLENGKKTTAIDVQEAFVGAAERHLRGRDADTDWTLNAWRRTLEALSTDPTQLVGKIDWISKEWLLETFLEAEGGAWDDTWMASLDLEYHNLNSAHGLSFALEEEGKSVRRTTDNAIALAVTSPPRNTRASGRGELIRSLLQRKMPYVINWSTFYIDGRKLLPMEDPFKTYTSEVQAYLRVGREV